MDVNSIIEPSLDTLDPSAFIHRLTFLAAAFIAQEIHGSKT